MADDYAGSTSTTGTVSVGGSRSGNIEIAGDTDWFRITLVAGQTYQFDLVGSSLADPFLRLRDSAGNSLAFDDDGGSGLNSRITFTATSSGTYYLSVGSATSSGIGTYTVSAANVTPPPPSDDYAGSTSTTGTVSVGGSRSGNIETAGDTDWFRVTLTAGQTYQFDLSGNSLADPFLRLRDSAGNSLAFDDDGDSGLNSRITFTATSSGTYYLSVGSSTTSGTGTYTVAAANVTPPPPSDDYAGSTATTGTVSVGGSRSGNIETAGDTDWFAITLVAGQTYQFDLTGNSLADPFLRLRDSAGNSLAFDDDGGTGLNSQITFTAMSSGTHYLSVGSSTTSGTGTYTVSAANVSPPPPSDDYAGSTATTGTVSVGGSRSGNIETAGDTDWFAINLVAGQTYQFDLRGSATGGGSLLDPFLRLRDSAGNSLTFNDDNGVTLDSRITFTATSSGTYYLSVGSSTTSGTGTYTVAAANVTPPPPSDDYAGSTSTTGTVSVGGSRSGNIETAGDTDWFAITLVAGQTYQFDLRGSATGGGSLPDPFLRLRDGAGNSLTFDDDSGTGLDARIAYTATSNGVYYLSVGSSTANGVGNYLLSAVNVSPATNSAPTVSGPANVSFSTGQTVAASQLFASASDIDGSVATIRFWDTTSGAGHFEYDGVAISGGFVDVSPALLSHLTYVTGGVAGTNDIIIEAFDNQGRDSNDLAVHITIKNAGTNIAPVITGPSTVTTLVGQTLAASELFTSASDTDGSIAFLRFWDSTEGAGYLAYDGVRIGDNYIDVSLSNLAHLTYVTGSAAGTNDIAIEAFDNSGASTDLAVRIQVNSTSGNHAPLVSAPPSLSFQTGEVIAASQLISSYSDSDGTVAQIRFWDSHAGAGYFALDGTRINTAYVEVPIGELSRVTYVTGSNVGTNDISVEVIDNLGRDSTEAVVRITVGGGGDTPPASGPNAVIPYNDASPGSATPSEVVQIARSYKDKAWGGENCTGFVWLVADQAGARFFDRANRYTDSTETFVIDAGVQPVYDAPGNGPGDVDWDDWAPVPLPPGQNWFDVVEPGDLVRVHINGYGGVHSFIVSEVTGTGSSRRVSVIDNTTGVIREYEMAGETGFQLAVLDPIEVWVQRLNSAAATNPESYSASWTVGSEVHEVSGGSSVDALQIRGPIASATSLSFGADAQGRVQVTQGETGPTLVTIDDYEELSIEGGAGADRIVIGSLAGTDIADSTLFIYGGDGADQFDARASDRRIEASGGADSDWMLGGSSADLLAGDSGNDTIGGGSGNDTLDGGAGDDTITGGLGADTVTGGEGDDTIHYTFGDGIDVTDGGAGTDTLVILGTFHGQTLDVIWNGTAFTSFKGGTLAGIENASADLGLGTDTLRYVGSSAAISVNLALGTATGFTSIAGVEFVYGANFDDTIIGDGFDNRLEGEGGADTISGADGADVITAGTGNDIVDAGSGNDIIRYAFGDGTDATDGGDGTDVLAIFGSSAGQTLDVVWNGTAFTSFRGGTLTNVEQVRANMAEGVDTLTYVGSTSAVTVNVALSSATGFTDVLNIENATGAEFNDSLTGNAGANVLIGNGGDDVLVGFAGADTLIGGAGADAMTGGNDADVFVFQPGSGADTINAFDANPLDGQDILRISGYGVTAATFSSRVTIADLGSDTLVTIDGVSTILLVGVNGNGANVIDQSDFLLAS